MINVIHDGIDARDNMRASANDIVNAVWETIRDRGAELAAMGGDFDELLEAIAEEVADRLATLTTEAARAGREASLARQEAAGGS